jgi:hypothetical protein
MVTLTATARRPTEAVDVTNGWPYGMRSGLLDRHSSGGRAGRDGSAAEAGVSERKVLDWSGHGSRAISEI